MTGCGLPNIDFHPVPRPWHLHEWDYVVIPQTDGELLLVDAEGQEQNATLTQGVPYYRKAGVEHNVINAGTRELIFTEVEMKAHPIEDDLWSQMNENPK